MNITHNGKTMTDRFAVIYSLISSGYYISMYANIYINQHDTYRWEDENGDSHILVSHDFKGKYDKWLEERPLLRELL